MSSPPQATEVSLNDRVAAVATVLCDGDLRVMNRDPFVAVLPPVAPDALPIYLRTFAFEAAETAIVEISSPFATQVPSHGAIDDWAIRQGHRLYNVYVVREDTAEAEYGSILKAQSSIIATGLTVPVLEIAVGILAAAATGLSADFHGHFATSDEAPSTPAVSQPIEPRASAPADVQHSRLAGNPSVGHAAAMPGYL